MSRVSYFCPDTTHSLCLHHLSLALLQEDKWQLSLSLPTSQPCSQESVLLSSYVQKILDCQTFLIRFFLCTQFLFLFLIVSALSHSILAGHLHAATCALFLSWHQCSVWAWLGSIPPGALLGEEGVKPSAALLTSVISSVLHQFFSFVQSIILSSSSPRLIFFLSFLHNPLPVAF